MPLFGNARVPVIIGEGQTFFTANNKELFRGSSSVASNPVVDEIISDQIQALDAANHTYQTTYFPIVSASTGVVTNDVTQIQVTDNGVPLTVISLQGATGTFSVMELVLPGDQLEVNYNFKKTDTLISNENLSSQIPSFASATLQTGFTVSTTNPGALGNLVTITLTQASSGNGVSDLQAVTYLDPNASGLSNVISVELCAADGTIRTLGSLMNLLEGIQTLSAGYLVVTLTASPTTPAVAKTATLLTGGAGPSSNTTFTVANAPIVDGTNAGVVTTNPKYVTVLVNGVPQSVASLNGQAGSFVLATGVSQGSTLTISYYTNTFQNTSDLLPANNVSSVLMVGLGPNRQDYLQNIDYVLTTDANGNSAINWGASYLLSSGVMSGTTSLAAATTPALVDEYVYFRPAVGVCNGQNTTFGLEFIPVDGSGRGVTTNNPKLVNVYVGASLNAALSATVQYPLLVSGNAQSITLYNPPQTGQQVFVSYYRNRLAANTYTLTVANANLPGQGTYTVTNALGVTVPTATPTFTVADTNFASAELAGMVGLADLSAPAGAASETISVAFNKTVSSTTTGAQASAVVTGGLTLLANTPGIAGNSLSVVFNVIGTAGIAVSGNVITIQGQQTATTAAALFPQTVAGIVVTASGSGSTNIPTSTVSFSGGVNPVTTTSVVGYTVSSTGRSAGIGYFGQTYIDAQSGVKFTLNVPDGWAYATTDTLSVAVNATGAFVTGSNWNVAIPGVKIRVSATLGMNPGDTATLQTFNSSGKQPLVGEYYYVSYTTPKQASDMALQLFNNPSDAYALYGQPSPVNRVSLGIQLMCANGAQTFGVIQVPQQVGLNTASDDSFTAAIDTLKLTLPGSNQKANVVVPLSSSLPVIQYLSNFLITQADVRNRGEAIGFVGFASGTDSTTMSSYAASLFNERIIAMGTNQLGVILTDSKTALSTEYAVSGEFLAAAMAGLNINPVNDVAQTLTLQNIVGFSRAISMYDEPTMNLMASNGLTIVTNNNGALEIRHYKTTNPSNPITSEPTSTTVTDYMCQQFRADTKQFVGRKMVTSLITDITTVCNARLANSVNNNILTTYRNLSVVPDPIDPTTVNVSAQFKPMFCLLWISINFTVTITDS
jgi:hypothetical protein